MNKVLSAVAAGVLVLAACGDDDGGGGGDAAAAKDTLFEDLMSELEEDDDVDRDCVRELVDGIPDDQAVIIADNLDAEEIPEGVDEATLEAVFGGFLDCFDFGDLEDITIEE